MDILVSILEEIGFFFYELGEIVESLLFRLYPEWKPNNEEERRFIEKRENVEWDFESTEVDIQLSVVKRNVINLIDDMQHFAHPKLLSELVHWAMKVDDYRRLYRVLLEEGSDRSARDSCQQIMRLGYTAEDIILAHPSHKIKERGRATHYALFRLCGFMVPTLQPLLDDLQPLLDDLREHVNLHSVVASNDKDLGGQEAQQRLITQMYDRCRGYVTFSEAEFGPDKTTFARKLYERAVDDTNHEFQMCAWVTVLQGYDIRDICLAIVEYSDRSNKLYRHRWEINSADIKFLPATELVAAMYEELVDLQYMLVLDDVHYVWPEIQRYIHRLFPVNPTVNRSTVIFTTSDADFSQPQHQPTPLLNMSLGNQTDPALEFSQRSLAMANVTLDDYTDKCALRQIFEENTKARWPQLLTLARVFVTNPSTYINVLSSELKSLSLKSLISWDWQYHMLPPRIRPCYLYMSLFPHAFEIPTRRLIRLWIAEGLVIKSDLPSTKTLEDVALSYVVLLQTRKLIQVKEKNGRPKTCWIAEDKYKFFSWKAKDLGVFYVRNVPSGASSPPKFNVRRLAEDVDITEDYPPDIEHLRSWIDFTRKRDTPAVQVGDSLDKYIKRIDKQRFGLLRVLDLEGVYKPLLKDETLEKLVFLTYLGLRWTFLHSLPGSIGALPQLETLDVKHTNITNLPSSIWKARNLLHLYMNQVHLDLSTKKGFTVSLTKLETLWGLSIGSNSLVVKRLSELYALRKLGLTYHPTSAQAIANWVKKLENLESLRLRSFNEFGEPSELKLPDMTELEKLSDLYLVGVLHAPNSFDHDHAEFQFPSNLKILTLTGSKLQGSDSIRVLEELKQLNTLRLYGQSFLGDEIIFYDNKFPNLIVLKLWRLEKLKRLEMQGGSLPRLEELDIRGCINLKDVKGLEQLISLKMITLTNMPANFVKKVSSEVNEDVDVYVDEWDFSSASSGDINNIPWVMLRRVEGGDADHRLMQGKATTSSEFDKLKLKEIYIT